MEETQRNPENLGGTPIAEKIRAALFYAALSIEILVVLIDKSDLINPWESYFFRLTFVLTMIAVILSERSVKEWLFLAVALCVGVISYRITGRNEILRIVMFVAACRGRSKKRMLGIAFFETAAGSVLIMLLAVAGLFGTRTLTMLYRAQIGEEETRYTLGFGHPNALHTMFMMLVILWMLYYGRRVRIWQYLLVLLADIGLYLLTDSRIGVIMTAMLLLAGVCVRLQEKVCPTRAWSGKKWPYLLGGLTLLACCAFSVWSAWVSTFLWDVLPNMRIPRDIDIKLTQRISDLHYAEEHAGLNTWTLFSSSGAQRYFDMGWCRLFYWYGIIPGILTVLILLWFMDWCRKKQDILVLIITVGLCVYTVVEAHLVSVYIGRNVLLLLLGVAFTEKSLQSRDRRYSLLPERFRRVPGKGGNAG